jgi:hypothetical protein
MFCHFYPGLAVVQALASPAPPHTPSAASVTAAPTQKAPTAPANNVVPPFTAAVQSDTTSPDPAPAEGQSETTSPDPACSTGAESVMPAGVSFSLPAQHGLPLQQHMDVMRESPKKESHKRKSEEDKINRREILGRKAKDKRKDLVGKKRGFAENAERKMAAEQEMRARQNEEELIALENLIAEAQETMDLGIEDID